jgi:cyclopropane fatty-acyl-phospholipid synthase-like methyltransferase
MPDHSSPQAIRDYYNQNTRLFLRFGSSDEAQTIHRAVWAPGVETLQQALSYSNNLLLEEINSLMPRAAPLLIADLGCGVGASLFYLLARLTRPARATGLTISSVQAHLAHKKIPRNLPHPCTIIEADFHHPPLASGFDFIYSIEAYVHASDPAAYISGAARLLASGGRLALCDDFLAPQAAQPGLAMGSRRWLEAYRHGWYIPNLCPVSKSEGLANAHGLRLISDRPLTSHLRLRALPDPVASLLLAIGRRLPQRHAILPSMLGSMALQQCLRAGLIEYHFLVFEKQET